MNEIHEAKIDFHFFPEQLKFYQQNTQRYLLMIVQFYLTQLFFFTKKVKKFNFHNKKHKINIVNLNQIFPHTN